ncbi:LCP family protein [Propionibacterium freudenreichii]|uniref:LCP family protein n=1 Tax=Propionibacterium freudenreichii TaxID=1744 RepID=UPI000BC2EA55|nr:LCP family protein [Propionibacterium freudenreichii]SBN44645.1 Putative CONSERVED PROTEIN CPSA [Propionibacterium freudenreichii]
MSEEPQGGHVDDPSSASRARRAARAADDPGDGANTPRYADSAAKRRRGRLRPRWGRIAALAMALVLFVVVAAAGIYIWRANAGIKRSGAIADKTSQSSDLDLLVMGLDSRVDVNGNALPSDIYDALHSGDASDGGLNSNVLMYVHVPADGSQASVFAIPRDDYVDFPGCPDGVCKGKIKEAYGYAADAKTQELDKQGKTGQDAYQQARDAGRAAEVRTVEQFLGVEIDHFIEVTMVAFFQIAQVVQPITVCVNEKTVDTYSGADFKAGEQYINAEQAMAFVRQRRDTDNPDLAFTDLDRSRRQQAFIASLLVKLKKTNLLTNPGQLDKLVQVAQQNTVLDKNLKISQLTSLATSLEGSKLNFYTLPVESFGTADDGAAINVVDKAKIQGIVRSILHPGQSASPSASASASGSASYSPTYGMGATVSVMNESGVTGAAASLVGQLTGFGFTAGQATNGADILQESSVSYGSAVAGQAKQLAQQLGGLSANADSTLGANAVVVHMGTGFTGWPSASPSAASSAASTGGSSVSPSASSTAIPSAVDANSGGQSGPEPSQLTQISGGGIPCVK